MLMNRGTIVFITVAAFLILLVSIAVRSSRSSSPTLSTASNGANTDAKPAPQFELKTLDGRVVKLSDFRGKAVILNFWATWCAPCRVETPWLVQLYRDYNGQGLEIVGISMDDGGPHLVEKFVHEMNVNYTVLMGNNSVSETYGGLRFLPQTFLIDRDGNIVSQTLGPRRKNDLENDIKRLLDIK
jgi:peroxiredoxin